MYRFQNLINTNGEAMCTHSKANLFICAMLCIFILDFAWMAYHVRCMFGQNVVCVNIMNANILFKLSDENIHLKYGSGPDSAF